MYLLSQYLIWQVKLSFLPPFRTWEHETPALPTRRPRDRELITIHCPPQFLRCQIKNYAFYWHRYKGDNSVWRLNLIEWMSSKT